MSSVCVIIRTVSVLAQLEVTLEILLFFYLYRVDYMGWYFILGGTKSFRGFKRT